MNVYVLVIVFIFIDFLLFISVNKIKTILWYMQEDLESFRQGELGEAIDI